MFILMFLGTYLNLIYLRKYSQTPREYLSILLFIIQFGLIFGTLWAGMILGHTYSIQGLTGLVYGGFYTLLCLQFDTQLHRVVANAIFLQKKARKHKFHILFFTIGIMVLASVLFNLDFHDWRRPPNLWLTLTNEKCKNY